MKILLKSLQNRLPKSNNPTVTRITLEGELKRQFEKLKPGIVLDVGSRDPFYKKYIPTTQYLRLDLNSESAPDLCCDLHDITWQSEYFDTIIATEVLEHLYSPERAISEIQRIMKPGGILIGSTRFVYPYHGKTQFVFPVHGVTSFTYPDKPAPRDYYRFTPDALNYLFRNFTSLEIYHHGNTLLAIWELLHTGTHWKVQYIMNFFNKLVTKIPCRKTNIPCGFIFIATK